VGRLGGDEFGVIVLHAEEEQAHATCARIARALDDRPFVWGGSTIPIRFTAGAIKLIGSQDVETAIAAADAAMYRHKALRR